MKPKRRASKCPSFEVENRIESEARDWARKGSGERSRWAHLQKIFENSYLKPCNLVYSSSENPSFPIGGSWNLQKMGTGLISIPAKFQGSKWEGMIWKLTSWRHDIKTPQCGLEFEPKPYARKSQRRNLVHYWYLQNGIENSALAVENCPHIDLRVLQQ